MKHEPTTEDHTRVIAEVAARVARRYVNRASWASKEDLEQEAKMVAFEARGRWDPEVRVPFQAYIWQVCIKHLGGFVWRSSAPVSFSNYSLMTDRPNIRTASYPLALRDDYEDSVVGPDIALDEESFQRRLREQVEFLIAARPKHEQKAVVMVLVDDEPPREVAKKLRMPVTRVYQIAHRARRMMAKNAVLFDLWKERTAHE